MLIRGEHPALCGNVPSGFCLTETLRGPGFLFKVWVGGKPGVVGCKGDPQDRQLLAGLGPPLPLTDPCIAPVVQRSIILASWQRFTLQQTFHLALLWRILDDLTVFGLPEPGFA